MEITAQALGFSPSSDGWQRTVAGRELHFRRVRTRSDFEQCERLQREVFGVSEHDQASFSIMVIIPKTGGEVLGAFDSQRMVGYIQGYGGYVNGQPRLISDLMAVEPEYRGGLGYALKILQAAVTLEAGFEEMVWTVDPLRAANARLNFERLGAHSSEYVENLYGDDFAEGLYGGMPSDRLVVTWPLTSERVRQRLLSGYQPLGPDALAGVPDYNDHAPARVRVAIPSDIDTLLAHDAEDALIRRYRVRAALESAFANGYTITGFAGHRGSAIGNLQLERSPDWILNPLPSPYDR